MAKTTNEELLDAVLRHQIFLLRYSGHVRNRVNGILNQTEEELARRIRDQLRNSGGVTTSVEWRRLESLLAALEAVRMEGWQQARQFLVEEMTQLAYREPIVVNAVYTTVIPVQVHTVMPSSEFLRAIALSRPFEGRLLREWADSMASDDVRRIHAAVQAGMVAGEDHATIARRVVGTANLRGADGVTEVSRRQVQAVVRTAVQHVANSARNAFFDANSDLITEEQFVATLDSRTTPQCRALDGMKFPLSKGPQPPLHFNCRSLRIAVIDGVLAGQRPANPTTEKLLVEEYAKQNNLTGINSRGEIPKGMRGDYDKWARGRIRQMVGPVPATETYQTWLKKQSAAFQNEVLGDAKGTLFRQGGLTLDKFVDLRTGREFTLSELAKKHAEAFRAAGLDPRGF
jgi:SPP1 gp7 family putative phage head morphogenesis protein